MASRSRCPRCLRRLRREPTDSAQADEFRRARLPRPRRVGSPMSRAGCQLPVARSGKASRKLLHAKRARGKFRGRRTGGTEGGDMKPSTLCAAAILAAGALAISSKVQGQNKSAPAGGSDRVARGRYLTLVGGCGDCHSPKKVQNGQPLIVEGNPVEDQSRLLSGHPEADKL